jgi:hypothetical protein
LTTALDQCCAEQGLRLREQIGAVVEDINLQFDKLTEQKPETQDERLACAHIKTFFVTAMPDWQSVEQELKTIKDKYPDAQ